MLILKCIISKEKSHLQCGFTQHWPHWSWCSTSHPFNQPGIVVPWPQPGKSRINGNNKTKSRNNTCCLCKRGFVCRFICSVVSWESLHAVKAKFAADNLLVSAGTPWSCQLRTTAASCSRRRWLSILQRSWETNWICLLCTTMTPQSSLHQQVSKARSWLR